MKSPGCTSRARWMAKCIYCLKIYLYRKEFKLPPPTEKFIREICKFTLKIYLKHWFTCPSAIKAPLNDLNLLKSLVNYESVNKEMSETAFHSFSHQQWYLNESLVGAAFFDERISMKDKRKMVTALQSEPRNTDNRITIPRKDLMEKEIHSFVSKRTLEFLTDCGINLSWLNKDPISWPCDKDYKIGKIFFEKLSVVNDAAERGIKLMHSLRKSTSCEQKLQDKIQVIEQNRKDYPNCKKSTILGQVPKKSEKVLGSLRKGEKI